MIYPQRFVRPAAILSLTKNGAIKLALSNAQEYFANRINVVNDFPR